MAEVFLFSTLASTAASEPLGQSSRRTSLAFSEVMYHPAARTDGKSLEFIELFNSLDEPQDLSGWRLDGDADFVFPPTTVLPGRGFLVIAQSPSDLEAVYGLTGVLGPFSNTNSLPNDHGVVQLRNRTGAVFLEAHYDSQPPWPAAADGAGHSLVLARPSYGEANVEAWAASDRVGGSPGAMDPPATDPLRHVLINEFLANTDAPALDFVELYNHSNQALDISGCYLTDSRSTNKFVVPPNTVLPPRGFISFDQNQLGFAVSSAGETIYFRNPADDRVLDAVRFGGQALGVSTGRFPDGAPDFSELQAATPATANAPGLIREIVINELMFHPISGDNDDEYVELYNRGAQPVALGGWRLNGGIGFTFPADATIPADGYLVIAHNAARLMPRYPNLTPANTVGDYSGSLANSGERVALEMPEPSVDTNATLIRTNWNFVVVDEVTYREGGRWGKWADGGGSSLELIDPHSDNRRAANWTDSDETAKASWTAVAVTGIVDHTSASADQLQVLLQGPGECLIDDVEVLNAAGANQVANSTFESGAGGWIAEGTEQNSGLSGTEGFNSARSYHVRATERGDNQINRIRAPLIAVQNGGSTNTIRARVRWLRGHPEVLFRFRGNGLEAPVEMDLPANLGTPGAVNSRAASNAGPAIYAVSHQPVLPAANEPVVVTARAGDPDGLNSVALRYRVDPSSTFTTVPMRDDGTGGDAVAGDGLFSATIPGQSAGQLVAFHVQAADDSPAKTARTFPDNAPTRECLVRFGETLAPGDFPSYRMWMTEATYNTWTARHKLDNTLNDVTFVLGDSRVIYNAGAIYAGSPYIAPGYDSPTGKRCGYEIDFPPDEPFLGGTALVLDWPGGHGNENTAIQEQMAYWIADQMNLPFSHRYFIRLTVNGVTDMQRGGVFEAVFQPGGDFLQQWSPGDAHGDFYKIDRAFEFNDNGGKIADPMPQLKVYTTTDVESGAPVKKAAAYRWNWLKRFFDGANDYTNIFVLADALNASSPEPYTAATERLADVDEWMGIFATEHIINNFDSWGHTIGKNMYMYKPANGRWRIYMFDLDWLMLVSPNGPGSYTASTGPLFAADDPTITRMYSHPPFRRAYFRAVRDAVNNAFNPARYEAVMDAKYQALVANGITKCDGQSLVPPDAVKTWFSQRRDFLVNQLDTVAADFVITSNNGADFTVASNYVTLTGTAPVEAATLRVNGVAYAVTWTDVKTWSLRLPLEAGANALEVQACDSSGQPLPNLSASITVSSTAAPESPAGRVVINELMYHPLLPGAEFVELFNNSGETAFDLSGWRLNGAGFTFDPGTILGPGEYLLLAHDPTALSAAVDAALPIAGVFDGRLDNGGETLTLVQPGATADQDVVVDRLTFSNQTPWPSATDGGGASLQLIDATRDNNRVANWSDGSGWRFFTFTGTPGDGATNFLFFLASAGDVYVDDVRLVRGAQPGVGTNELANGDFESGDLGPWRALGNHSDSAVEAGVAASGGYSLHIRATGIGAINSTISQIIPPLDPNSEYTLSFRYRPSPNGRGLYFRMNFRFRLLSPLEYQPMPSSPGGPNVVAATLPAFPAVWINELMPDNPGAAQDSAGESDPWMELYNSGTSPVSLDGWDLADNYTNLARWPFPTNATIAPGQFLVVWADGDAAQSTASEWHTSFRLPPENGSIALVFPMNGQPTVLDYANYRNTSGRSLGFYPDGQAGRRQSFYSPTPGAPNDDTPPDLPVFINEWMAANSSFMADPADGHFDDWFELFNPNPVNVDLTGYALADNPQGQAKWDIPAATIIPANGFLLVWADGDLGQNGTNGIGLHAGFRLNQTGEAIALFAPNGALVDAVTFAGQTNDVSEGRSPDGGDAFVFNSTPTPGAANGTGAGGGFRILNPQLSNNGEVLFHWTTQPGGSYRIQFKDSLDAASWSNLVDMTASGSLSAFTNQVSGARQRFYRIQLLSQ